MKAGCLLAALLLVLTPRVFAQQAEVRASASPHYAGVSIDVQVTVDGLERSPEPTIDVEPPAGAALELAGVSPNVSSSITVINGRMTRRETVRFVFGFRLIAPQAGDVVVGPFRITQGSTTVQARAVRFRIETLPTTSEQRLRLLLPEGPLWVGQRVPVSLEWWLTKGFAERLASRRARVPLFDRVDRFTFEDREVADTTTTLSIDTAAGTLELPVTVRRDEWQGKSYLVVTVERTLIALKPGEVTIEPATLVTEEAVRWSRDFFGGRVPASVRRLQVSDEPRTITFASPPATGRPASFSGAVGKGFSIEVSADRSVVQTGDPIQLAIDVRGDTALDAVSLPRLAESGLDPRDFNTPDGPIAGSVEDGVKRFEVSLRVNHDQVREIPPVELSWFDPEHGRYETTRSRPIALSVRAATMVSAADVVTGEASSDDAGDLPEPAPTPEQPSRPAFTLSGAELAIETRPRQLRAGPAPWHAHPAALGASYLGGLACLALAVVARRRASADPALRTRRRTLETEREAVARAPGAGGIARALRRMAAASPPAPREEFESLLVECDNLAYAPGAGDDAPVDARLRSRALAVADTMLAAAR